MLTNVPLLKSFFCLTDNVKVPKSFLVTSQKVHPSRLCSLFFFWRQTHLSAIVFSNIYLLTWEKLTHLLPKWKSSNLGNHNIFTIRKQNSL
jgi:hypothetical protein